MKISNVFKKFQKIKFAAGFIVVGLFISIIAGFMFIQPDGNFEKVNATITSIKSEGMGEDEIFHVMVSYEVDGQTFESELGSYSGTWDVGDVIECEYNVENHAEIRSGSGKLMSLIICVIGFAAVVFGFVRLVKDIKTPSNELSQYDRVDETKIDSADAEKVRNNIEPMEDFVFHYTGKMNQSHVMKDRFEKPVYEGVCEGITLVKDTTFEFKNLLTGESSVKKISHTKTTSMGNGTFSSNINSAFKIDGVNCWDYLASKGISFEFTLKGMKCHYEVKHWGVPIGYVETAGTEVMNEKYKNNPLAKIPTNGIYRISCQESEIENMFMVAFCITKTEFVTEY